MNDAGAGSNQRRSRVSMMTVRPFFSSEKLLATILAAAFAALLSLSTQGAENDTAFVQALSSLTSSNFKDKEEALSTLAATRHPNTRKVLAALLDGNLYYRREDQHVFIAQSSDEAL